MLKVFFLYIIGMSLLFQPVLVLAEHSETTFYTVAQNKSSKTQSGVSESCTDCLQGDSTVREIKSLKTMTCEEIIKSPRCKDVSKIFLRNCEEKNTYEAATDFGVGWSFGCMSSIVADFGFVPGIVAGILSIFLGSTIAVTVTAGGLVLYLYTELDSEKITDTVIESDKWKNRDEEEKTRELWLMYLFGEGLYQLFVGEDDLECYNTFGKAMLVCGLFDSLKFTVESIGIESLGGKSIEEYPRDILRPKIKDYLDNREAQEQLKNPVPNEKLNTIEQ